VQAVLGHLHRDRRQLGDLVPRWLSSFNAIRLGEDARTGWTPLRPVLDDLVDPLGWKQPPMAALVPELAAPLAPAPRLLRARRRRRRILRRRQRRVARAPTQPPLQLGHPSLESLVRLHQLAHSQQQRDSRLTITVENRLRLSPLHTSGFAACTWVPARA